MRVAAQARRLVRAACLRGDSNVELERWPCSPAMNESGSFEPSRGGTMWWQPFARVHRRIRIDGRIARLVVQACRVVRRLRRAAAAAAAKALLELGRRRVVHVVVVLADAIGRRRESLRIHNRFCAAAQDRCIFVRVVTYRSTTGENWIATLASRYFSWTAGVGEQRGHKKLERRPGGPRGLTRRRPFLRRRQAITAAYL